MMKKNHGQSLFEVVLAIGLIALVLFALAGLLAQGQKNASNAKDESDRSRAVSAVNEWLRTQRDNNWSAFYAKAPNNARSYCLNTLPSDVASLSEGECAGPATGKSFSIGVSLSHPTPDPGQSNVKADVSVSWTDSQGTHTQTFTSYFTNWKGQ